MKRHTKYWASFFVPGGPVSERVEIDCDSDTKPEDVAFPDNAYAFTLHKRTDITDGEDVFKGEEEQCGPVYYHPDSKVEALDEVALNPNATPILISNMKTNDWKAVVWDRWSERCQPFNPDRQTVLTT